MKMINSAVIFDMDGVIIDTEPLYTKAEIRLFREYNIEIPEEDWPLFRGCAEQDFFDQSMERYDIVENKHVFMEKGREYVREESKKIFESILKNEKVLKYTFDSVDELTGAEKKRLTQDILKANKSVGYVKKKKKRRGNK